MAAAVASESTTQLARLGLSEQEFKRKTELMRLYLQDNSGATSFDEFCKRQPAELPEPQKPPPIPKPTVTEAPKNTSNVQQKSFNPAPAYPPMAVPLPPGSLNPQMFGMMTPHQFQRHVFPLPIPGAMPMPGMLGGQPMPYYPPLWFNPAGLAPGQSIPNPWVALSGQQGALAAAPTTVSAVAALATLPDKNKAEEKDAPANEDPPLDSEVAQQPSTPKTPKRKNAEPSPFTPATAAIFISPPGSDLAGTPITAILRPDGTIIPTPLFHSPGIELLRPSKPPMVNDEIDPSTIFKLPSPPYSTEKPPYSYAALIGQALNAAHRKRACLDHIYLFISTVYPYYKRGEQAWQNSIRHNLSQNSSFTRLKHPSGGQHGEWAIREEDKHCFAEGGFVRSARPVELGRKRRRKGAFDDDSDLEEDVSPRKRAKKGSGKLNTKTERSDADVRRRLLSPPPSEQMNNIGDEFHLPSRQEIMARARNSDSVIPTAKKSQKKGKKEVRSKQSARRKKKKHSESEMEAASEEEEESEFEMDALSPLFGKGRPLKGDLTMLAPIKRREDDTTSVDEPLTFEGRSSKASSISPPLGSVLSELPSETQSEVVSEDEDPDAAQDGPEDSSFIGGHTGSQNLMERTVESARTKLNIDRESKRQERFKHVPEATLLNLSPIRRISTTPLKSAIRGTGPSHSLEDVMRRYPINRESRDEDSNSEEYGRGTNHEADDDERDREVTPPPLIPNPPWMHSPKPSTPSRKPGTDDDDDTLLSRPLARHTSICISPNSSHYHQHHTAFMTPARATDNGVRPFDPSFPVISFNSSQTRQESRTAEPVTPDRQSSAIKPSWFQTPLFSSAFSETRLEEDLARMARGDDSPDGFFNKRDLYRSPSVPGSSPNRWASH